MPASSVNSRDIEIALYHRNHLCEPMIPRYKPDDWFECDFLAVTKAGYAREFEIKTSHADFVKDFEKKATRRRHGRWLARAELKHDRLASGDCIPNYYWFVCPPNVIELEELPEYAGLMYAVVDKHNRVHLNVEKKALRLHKNKLDPWILAHIQRSFFFRYWSTELKLMQLKNDYRRPVITEVEKIRRRFFTRESKIKKIEEELGDKADEIRDYFSLPPEGDDWDRRRKGRRRNAKGDWKAEDWYRSMIRCHIGEIREGRRRLKRLKKLQAKDSRIMEERDIGRY